MRARGGARDGFCCVRRIGSGARAASEARSDRPQRRDHPHPLVAHRARSSQQDRELHSASGPRRAEFRGDQHRCPARRHFRRAPPRQGRPFGRRRAGSPVDPAAANRVQRAHAHDRLLSLGARAGEI